jgi:hypothetical protein
MKELKALVAQHNAWDAIFGSPALDLNKAADRQKIADKIDSALSPENLSCDGELAAGQVRARYRALTKAAEQLQKLDPTVKFYEYC